MLCADANRSILNMFSASSRRIAELRKKRGATSTWFKKRIEHPYMSDPTLHQQDGYPDDMYAGWDVASEQEAMNVYTWGELHFSFRTCSSSGPVPANE